MSKNIIREKFSDISLFRNSTIVGSYNPTIPDPNDPNPNAPSPPPANISPLTPYKENGVSYVDVPQPDGTKIKMLEKDYTPPVPTDNNIYKTFSLRMYKFPANKSNELTPVLSTVMDPKTNQYKPIVISQNIDDSGVYTSSSYMKALNNALFACIKLKDQCYAVVIQDPGDSSGSRLGDKYTFQLARKPLSNEKNLRSDSESLLCDQKYISYIKNEFDGKPANSNIMPNTISCDFSPRGAISYSGSANNTTNDPNAPKKDDKPVEIPERPYKKPDGPPWGIIIGIVVAILLIGGGLYYYFNYVKEDDTPAKIITHTSKLIKKKGGYFFFV